VIDRGAISAVFVGLGVAMVVAISFLLIIPIEPVYSILSVPSGLLVGYYAGYKSGRRRGAWGRFLANGFVAGLTTGLALAALLLAVKALFFYADTGYPTWNRTDQNGAVIPPTCQAGADCVYQRYLVDQASALAAAGVTDAASFGRLYWAEQLATAQILVLATLGGGLLGGAIYGATRPSSRPAPAT